MTQIHLYTYYIHQLHRILEDHDVLICLQTHSAGHLQPAVGANGCWQRLYQENGSWTRALTESLGTLVTT